ncbi:MAG TPA: AsmA family protein [Woeseiaceae bacterium]|nr:AsmA family protein [Woeseiaceae bacterium]
MSRLIKTLLLAVAGIVLLLVLTAGALLLFLDPNDYRDDIAARVEAATGRELTIEGDLSMRVFPWLAVEVGRTTLGNAEGFGDEPFARFDNARLSVRLLPLLLRQEIAVGTASLDALELNLAVNESGVTNWDDLTAAEAAAPAAAEESARPAVLDIASVAVTNATIAYRDAATGSRYTLEQVSLVTGRIALGEAFDVDSEFDFRVTPGDMSGHMAIAARTTVANDYARIGLEQLTLDGRVTGIARDPVDVTFAAPAVTLDLDDSRAALGELELHALGLSVEASVEPFSWAGDITVPAQLSVAPFSLKELLPKLDIEAPVTADPTALQRVAFSAAASISPAALALDSMTLTLDDTGMSGELRVPFTATEPILFDLRADRLNLDRYMAPASDTPAAADAGPVDDFEIPVDTIRGLEARGSLRIAEATLSGMTFSNVQLGLQSSAGKLRLKPLSAELFDGRYNGDIRIDASGKTPKLSLDEHVEGVSLAPLAQAMFEQRNLSGTINGNFALNAVGNTLAEMRGKLNGTMSFELKDGTWEGTDLWYQLRRARALYRQETPPEPSNPPRTRFTSVIATGTVTDGVFANKDLLAELPFLRLTGSGTVNLVAGEIDYALQARVLERPESLAGASDAELAEFTEALIPVRVRGPLADPSVRPDIEAMFRKEVESTLQKKGDELKQRLLDRLIKDQPAPANGETAPAEGETPPPAEEEKDAEDRLKDKLKDLFGP